MRGIVALNDHIIFSGIASSLDKLSHLKRDLGVNYLKLRNHRVSVRKYFCFCMEMVTRLLSLFVSTYFFLSITINSLSFLQFKE